MRNPRLKFASFVLSIVFVLTIIPSYICLADTISSGVCGPDITYTLDSNGTLRITGSGDMCKFSYYEADSLCPWEDYDDKIKKVVFSGNITSIGDSSFYGCINLTSVSIPSSVTYIGSCAFLGCQSLKSIVIPNSVTKFGVSVFDGCTSLESVSLSSQLSSIPWNTFGNCSSLTSVTVPYGITTIEENAFGGCSSLVSIDLPDSINMIENSAFYGCSSLESFIIPNNVSRIYSYTFYGCTNLKSITIPVSVTSINDSAFYECDSLTDVYYGGTSAQFEQTYYYYPFDDNVVIHYDTYILNIVKQPKDCAGTIGSTATFEVLANADWLTYQWQYKTDSGWVNSGASGSKTSKMTFQVSASHNNMKYRCVVTDPTNNKSVISNAATLYVVADDVVMCGVCGSKMNWTLYDNGKLLISGSGLMDGWESAADVPWADYRDDITSVVFSGDITYIGQNAFNKCDKLTSVSLPDSLRTIYDYAFADCVSLRSIILPDSLSYIGYDAFAGCESLKSINLPEYLSYIRDETFIGCTSLENVVIPFGIYTIGEYAFAGCTSLDNVVIPNSVYSIGDFAFCSCPNLANLTLSNNLYDIQYASFANCTSLTSVTIPSGVESIEDYAFLGCTNLSSIFIPDTVTSISYFEDCNSLTDVYYCGTQAQFQQIDGYDYAFDDTVEIHYGIKPISITEQPSDYMGAAGSTAAISVTATGTGLKYQWQVYSDKSWKNTGATGAKTSKITFNVTSAHDGMKYRCVITDSYGQKIISNAASVYVVGTPLTITKQPSNYTGTAGSTATFSVTASGTGLKYQWQVYSDGAWSNSGATGSKTNKISFNVTSAHNGKKYRCVITDSYGQKVTSNTVTVNVSNSLAITKQPVNYTGAAGSTASFSVTATGTGLTYQWQVYSNGAWSNSNASGSKTNKISFNVTNNHNGNKYRCIVKDSIGNKVYSNTATITVTTPLTITKQPSSFTGAAGSTATFSVTATGTGLTYQWQVYSNGAWSNSNANGSKTNKISFNVTNSHNGNKYRCIVKDSSGNKVYSNTATISVVNNSLTITKQPANYTGAAGSTATFSVTATGTGLTYQWQMYSDGAWKNSGATGAKTNKISFNVTNSHNGKKYRCVVTDSTGKKVISNTATVKVVTPLTITKQPVNYSGFVGNTASFSVTASGTGLTYQWQMYSDGAWKNSGASGSTTSKISFKVTSSHNGMKYRCVITDSYGQKVTTNTVSVRITTSATNYVMPADNSVEFDTTSPVIINNAAVSGVIESEDEQLLAAETEENKFLTDDRIDGVEAEEIEDKIQIPVLEEQVNAEEEEATENRLSLDGQQVVYSDGEDTVDEETAKGPSIVKQPAEYKGKAGEKVTFTVQAEGQGLRYQWQYCKDGEWINLDVEGADTAELILEITAADDGMQYRCVVTDFLGNTVITDEAGVIVTK